MATYRNEYGTIFVSKWRRTQCNPEATIRSNLYSSHSNKNSGSEIKASVNQNTHAILNQDMNENNVTNNVNNITTNNSNITPNNNINDNYTATSKSIPVPFQHGEAVVIRSLWSPKRQRDSRKLVVLESTRQLVTHYGGLLHDDIVGQGPGVVMATSTGSLVVVYRPTLGEAVEVALQDKKRSAGKVADYSFGFDLCGLPVLKGTALVIGELSPRVYVAACRSLGDSGRLFTNSAYEDTVQFVQSWWSRIHHRGNLTPVAMVTEQRQESALCDGVLITDKPFREENLTLAVTSTKQHGYVTVMSKRLDIISQYLTWLQSHPDGGLTYMDLTESYDRRWIVRKAHFGNTMGEEDELSIPYICRPVYKDQTIPLYYLRLRRTVRK